MRRRELCYVPPQTRKMSALETAFNISIGYSINQSAQILLFPIMGIHVPYSVNFELGAIFTAISVVRSYGLRRVFEWWRVNHAS